LGNRAAAQVVAQYGNRLSADSIAAVKAQFAVATAA
jgi:sugar/nucleoside kinase (ribokinase family)